MAIEADDVPPPLRDLIPLAKQWGIGDDIDRSMAVEDADSVELERLIAAVNGTPDEVLESWLGGPEASAPRSCDAYVAFMCLSMARDEARVVLAQRKRS